MTNLVPEQRFDKNNKLVTRHVRPAETGSASVPLHAPIPAPAFNDRERLAKARQEALEAIEDLDDWKILDSGSYASYLHQGMHHLNETTALMVRDSVTTPEMSVLCLHLVSDFHENPRDIGEVLFYRDAIAYTTLFNDSGFNYSDESVGMIRGIRHMKEFQAQNDLTLLPEDQARQVKALLRVGYAVYFEIGATHASLHGSCKWGVGARYPLSITDPELISLVMDNPEQDDSICELIRLHKAVDVEFLRESIAMNTPALVKGAL
jgi:hypothetical protein